MPFGDSGPALRETFFLQHGFHFGRFGGKDGLFKAQETDTSIFIYPPYKIQSADMLLTNFHLPKSTLLMLVSAFAGFDFVMEAYRYAVKEKMRFFSYGDCMLILNRI